MVFQEGPLFEPVKSLGSDLKDSKGDGSSLLGLVPPILLFQPCTEDWVGDAYECSLEVPSLSRASLRPIEIEETIEGKHNEVLSLAVDLNSKEMKNDLPPKYE